MYVINCTIVLRGNFFLHGDKTNQIHLNLFQINNPDKRVEILKDFVEEHFPSHPLLDYALQVEKITTSKVRIFI